MGPCGSPTVRTVGPLSARMSALEDTMDDGRWMMRERE